MVADDGPADAVNLDGMRSYLARTGVIFAMLFGSHARGTADDSSDVDVALCFPEEMDAHERFRVRNRIDAELQAYATGFVDVSDLDSLPTPVAYAAVRDGVPIVGDRETIEAARRRIEREYEETSDERRRAQREFVDRLASGDV